MNQSQQPQHYRTLKVIGALVALALVLLTLFLLPLTSSAPSAGPDVRLPSMQNIPAGTSLQLEVPKER